MVVKSRNAEPVSVRHGTDRVRLRLGCSEYEEHRRSPSFCPVVGARGAALCCGLRHYAQSEPDAWRRPYVPLWAVNRFVVWGGGTAWRSGTTRGIFAAVPAFDWLVGLVPGVSVRRRVYCQSDGPRDRDPVGVVHTATDGDVEYGCRMPI